MLAAEKSPVNWAEEKKLHRDQYAIEQEEREREEGWAENPSMDPETQKAIVDHYRALHEEVKQAGLYKCNYSAYAWESLRYGILFACFGYFLYTKWYLTSALFLGLFWVRSAHVSA